MTEWKDLSPELRETMSPEFWASLTEEERQARLRSRLDDISDEARAAYKPEEDTQP